MKFQPFAGKVFIKLQCCRLQVILRGAFVTLPIVTTALPKANPGNPADRGPQDKLAYRAADQAQSGQSWQISIQRESGVLLLPPTSSLP
jgi:hypothetical protein